MSAAVTMLGVSFATTKLRTTAKVWGQEPSGYQNTVCHLVIRDEEWTPLDIPVNYATEESGDQSFRYLGVQLDINNASSEQFQMLKDQISEMAATVMYRLASPDTNIMVI